MIRLATKMIYLVLPQLVKEAKQIMEEFNNKLNGMMNIPMKAF